MARTKVQSELIATNAISGTIIADGAITSTHLAANCVDSSELVTGSIDTIHIAANQVTATKIVTNGVLTRHISDDQVTAAKLANSINTDIATGVTANTTANAALPKAGGTMTGALTVSATTATINITGGSSGASLINFGDSDDGNVGRIYYDHTDNFMQFKTGDAERMRIDSSGNVGIGTATPQKKFHIEHTAGASEGILISGASDTAGHTAGILLRAEGGEADSALRAKAGIFLERTATYGIGKLHIANRHNSDNVSATISDAQITIYDNSVGIGTTSPSETLVVSGDALVTGQMYLGPNTVSRRPFAKTTSWGYSTGYRAVVLGSAATAYNTDISGAVTLSFNYDPSVNANGSFSGNGNEIIFRNGTQFVTPNAANNSWNLRNLVLKDGNVGIGTDSPSNKLVIAEGTNQHGIEFDPGTLSYIQAYDRATSDYGDLKIDAQTIRFGTDNGSERMRIDSSGNLFLNTTSAMDACFVQFTDHSNGEAFLGLSSKDDNNVGIRFGVGTTRKWINYRDTSNNLIWYDNAAAAERMRILSTGTLLVSTTTNAGLSNNNPSANYGFSFGGGQQVSSTNNDTNLILNMSNGSSNPHVQFRSNGGNTGSISTNGSAVSFNTGSDYRLKENVIPLKDGLDRVNKLNPVQFDWKELQETDEGFIAHEVQEIVPYVVKGEKDGEKIQTMDYGKLTPLLVKAIQEQQAIIDDLKSRIATLEG